MIAISRQISTGFSTNVLARLADRFLIVVTLDEVKETKDVLH